MALFRFSIGPVSSQGVEILQWSIKKIRQLYPASDVVVCYNQISKDKLIHLGVPLIDQRQYVNSLPYPPPENYQVAWKLFPPRLRPYDYEIFLDNDLLIFKKIELLDRFLNSDFVLLYQGLDDNRFGQYKDLVPNGMRINSGIFGMPPGFNPMFEKIIQPWCGYYDEQGLVAASLISHPRYEIIPLTMIPIIQVGWSIEDFLRNSQVHGIHFAGANVQYHPQFKKFSDIYQRYVKKKIHA